MDTTTRAVRPAGRRGGRRKADAWPRFDSRLVDAFFLCALVLGGAGSEFPLVNWLVVSLGLVVLAIRLPTVPWGSLDPRRKVVALLVLACFLLCLLQVIPLPRSLWQGLPGHALAAQIAAAAGVGGWTAWSLAPDRTLSAMTALVPATAALLIAAQASPETRRGLLRMVLVVALISAALAIVQAGLGRDSAPVLFSTRHRGFGVGFFVNRNHLALFLLLGMLIAALPGIPAPFGRIENARGAEWGMRFGALVLLAMGVLASLSRTGIFLLPITLATVLLIGRRGRVKPLAILGWLLLVTMIAFALRAAPPIEALLERFATAAEDKRLEYWGNTLDALRDSLPLGTGFGTFTLVYPTYEPLNQVRPDVVNHAHSDLMELVLEGGLPALALLVAWLAFVAFCAARARKEANSRFERLVPLVAGAATVLAVAASADDYPLRMSTISVVLALLVGLLLPVAAPSRIAEGRRPGAGARAGRWLVPVPLVVIAILVASGQWAQQLAGAGREEEAALLAPWSSQVQGRAATRYQMLGQAARSSQAARRALWLSPLDPVALRAEGMAALALGDGDRGAALMSLGARLGWRDGITQLWLVEQALAAGASGFAVQRIDGLVRQHKFADELLPYLPRFLHDADGRAALAEQLSYAPGWRTAFFNTVARDRTWTMPQLLDLLARLRAAGSPVTPPETALLRAVLADRGGFADVRRLWSASGGLGLVGDGGFDGSGGEMPAGAAPYAWRALPLAGVRLAIGERDGAAGKALSVSSDGFADGGALAQTIALPPGAYRTFLKATSQDLGLLQGLRMTLRCRWDGRGPRGDALTIPLTWSPGEHGWRAGQGQFVVPSDCPGQDLVLSIPQTGGRPFLLWVDGVSIRGGGKGGA